MQIYLQTSGILIIILALAHSALGEWKLLSQLKNDSLPSINGIPALFKSGGFSKNTIRFVWHITSVFGLSLAVILLHFSSLNALGTTELFIVKIISASMLLAGLITLILTKGAHMGWILFFAIGILCALSVF